MAAIVVIGVVIINMVVSIPTGIIGNRLMNRLPVLASSIIKPTNIMFNNNRGLFTTTKNINKSLITSSSTSSPVIINTYQQHRNISTIGLWASRPYAAAFDASRALLDPLSPGIALSYLSLAAASPIEIGQVALTIPTVLGAGYITLLLGQKMSSGGAFQHNYFMLFLYLVMSFAPTPCFQNLFADLMFVATWLTVSYFAFSLLPEIVLKDHVFTLYLIAFLLPIFPLAFSFMPIINTRSYLML